MDPIQLKAEAKPFATELSRAAAIDDADEPKTEDLIEMLREALEDIKAGRTRPANEVMRELRQMLAANSRGQARQKRRVSRRLSRVIRHGRSVASHLLQD
ncbi:MAG: hypothetical protein OXE95_09820 [Chloroflexi bacterium]|nr:hypothetical protein [Chloroflexota bacterium]MCY4247856.1 hypothetical protein [Chloroflexota bacterium]